LGVAVGALLVAGGLFQIVMPISGRIESAISGIGGVVLGFYFMFYGLTGYQSIYHYVKRERS
jgi:hypothetical protein